MKTKLLFTALLGTALLPALGLAVSLDRDGRSCTDPRGTGINLEPPAKSTLSLWEPAKDPCPPLPRKWFPQRELPEPMPLPRPKPFPWHTILA